MPKEEPSMALTPGLEPRNRFRDHGLADRRLTTFGSYQHLAPVQGVEPRSVGSEPTVLPIYHTGVLALQTGIEPACLPLGTTA